MSETIETDPEAQLLAIGTRIAADPRASRTLMLLTDALLRLVRDGGFEISVSELCREAGVHRTTFYGHYPSVEAFAGDVFTRVIDEIATVSPDLADAQNPDQLARLYRDTFAELLRHIASLRYTYQRVVSSPIGPSFRSALAQALHRRVQAMLAYWQDHGIADKLDLDQTAAFISGAFTGSLMEWVVSDSDDVDGTTEAVMDLLPPWWPRTH